MGRLVSLYFDLRFSAIEEGVPDPLEDVPALLKSRNSNLAQAAKALHTELGWLRQWFPHCTDQELVHIADLVTRALNKTTNESPEQQFLKLVAVEIGTTRARDMLTQIETHGRVNKMKRR